MSYIYQGNYPKDFPQPSFEQATSSYRGWAITCRAYNKTWTVEATSPGLRYESGGHASYEDAVHAAYDHINSYVPEGFQVRTYVSLTNPNITINRGNNGQWSLRNGKLVGKGRYETANLAAQALYTDEFLEG